MRHCASIVLFVLSLCGAGLAPSAGFAQSASGQPDPLDSAFEDPAELDDDDDFADFLPDAQGEAAAADPLEDINRPIFEMNLTLDRYVMRPVTRMYMEAPQPARNGVSNVLNNLQSPVILVNDLLQGEMSRAGATFGRFFINSVFGLFGVFDLADEMGLPGHKEDFGQTLASYGVGPGPYVVLPFLGPSNVRDVAGRVFDRAIDPRNVVVPAGASGGVTGVSLINTRSRTIDETETLEETSLDLYAAVRSLYSQNREFEIRNGRPAQEPPSKIGEAGQ